MTNIGLYLMLHKSDLVEMEGRRTAKDTLRSKGELLIKANHFASGEIEESLLESFQLFEQLGKELKEVGNQLELVKSIAELKRDIDFAQAHITEKVVAMHVISEINWHV